MLTQATFRAFLLGTLDEQTEASIEEALLSGRINSEYLFIVEEELIDEYVLGQLLPEEEVRFNALFFNDHTRRQKIAFARALAKCAEAHEQKRAERSQSRFSWMPGNRFSISRNSLLLASLGCTVFAAGWVVHDRALRHRLAMENQNARQDQHLAVPLGNSTELGDPVNPAPQMPPAQDALAVSLELKPGVLRGIQHIPVLELKPHQPAVSITLDLPYKPQSRVLEQVVNEDDEELWRQEVPASGPSIGPKTAAIIVPSAIFSSGNYRIRFSELSASGEPGPVTAYIFQVRKH